MNATNVLAMDQLGVAFLKGDVVGLRDYITRGGYIEAKDSNGRTAFHLAVYYERFEFAKFLISSRYANVNTSDRVGDSPLHDASYKGSTEIVRNLLSYGAYVSATNYQKETPLHKATYGGKSEVVELLLQRYAEPNLKSSSDGYTPLHLAVYCGHEKCFELLVGCSRTDLSSQDNEGATPLDLAVRLSRTSMVKKLHERLDKVHVLSKSGDADGLNELFHSINDLDEKRKLANLEADVFLQKRPLAMAAACNYKDVAEILLGAGADVAAVDKLGNTALHVAAYKGHTDLAKLLFKHKAPVNARNNRGWTPLHEGIFGKSGEVLRALLKAGADVNAQDDNGWAALHIATFNGHVFLQEILIGKNANLLLKTKAGETALDLAIKEGHLTSVHHLLERMADQKGFGKDEHVTSQSLKALHFAVASDSVGVKVLAFLLDRSPELASSKDLKGRTALRVALSNGTFDKASCILDTLDKTGASVLDQDDDGCTPLHYACRTAVDHSVNSNGSSESKPLHSLSSGSAEMNELLKIVTRLLNLKDTLYARDNKKRVPMHYAAEGGSVELVEKLLSAAKDQELSHPKPSKKKARSNVYEKASEFGTTSATPTPPSASSPLSSSASENSAPLSETATYGMYRSSSLRPNDDSLSLFSTTRKRGAAAPGEDNSSTGVNFCLDCRDKKGDTPLALAMRNEHTRVVECLLRGGPMKSHDEEWFPLHIAATLGLSSLVPFLITERRSHVDDTDKRGQTALHVAASQGHSQVIRTLLAEGASASIRDASRSVPLHLAARGGHVDAIIALLDVSGSTGATGPDPKSIPGSNQENAEGSTKRRRKAEAEDKEETLGGLNPKLREKREQEEEDKRLAQKQKDLRQNLWVIDVQRNTPLHLAARVGDAECVKALIARGANVFAIDHEGRTPLFVAVQENHLDAIKALIAAKASVAVTDKQGLTLIHTAAESGDVNILKALLDLEVDISVLDNQGRTALHVAAKAGQVPFMEALIAEYRRRCGGSEEAEGEEKQGKKGEHREEERKEQEKVKEGEKEVKRKESEVGKRDVQEKTTISSPSSSDAADAIMEKIEARDLKGCTALYLAADVGKVAAIETLVAAGASITTQTFEGRTPLHAASEAGEVDTVLLLLDKGAAVNPKDVKGLTPLLLAARNCRYEAIEILLKRGADIQARSNDNMTALHIAAAASENSVEDIIKTIQILALSGADVNAINEEGEGASALHLAIISNSVNAVPVVQVLLRNGANPNAQNAQGRAAIHMVVLCSDKDDGETAKDASSNLIGASDAPTTATATAPSPPRQPAPLSVSQAESLIESLTSSGANVDCQDAQGDTAMHLAVARNLSAVAQALAFQGADIDSIRNGEGLTALDLAQQKNLTQLRETLVQIHERI